MDRNLKEYQLKLTWKSFNKQNNYTVKLQNIENKNGKKNNCLDISSDNLRNLSLLDLLLYMVT